MIKFVYKGKNASGDMIEGQITANNKQEAQDMLHKNNIITIYGR